MIREADMKRFEEPLIELICFEETDIVTTSSDLYDEIDEDETPRIPVGKK